MRKNYILRLIISYCNLRIFVWKFPPDILFTFWESNSKKMPIILYYVITHIQTYLGSIIGQLIFLFLNRHLKSTTVDRSQYLGGSCLSTGLQRDRGSPLIYANVKRLTSWQVVKLRNRGRHSLREVLKLWRDVSRKFLLWF